MIGAETKRYAETIVQARKQTFLPDLAEIWNHRELVAFFVWRDTLVRYKRTALGVGWVVIQPLMMSILFSVLFGRFSKLPSGGIPYQLLAFSGLLPWLYFTRGVADASTSLSAHRGLITKIFFPRIVIPLSSILPGMVDLLVSFTVLMAMVLANHIPIGPRLLLVIPIVPMLFIATFGPAIWLAGLTAYYRDFRIITPFIIQFWMFASPVAYSSSVVPEEWRMLYAFNPLVGIIDGLRYAVLGIEPAPFIEMGISFAVALIICFTGLWHFKRIESSLVDVV